MLHHTPFPNSWQNCNILICMQKHSQHNKDERTQFFRKTYLSLYSKGLRNGYCVRGWVGRLNKDCNILTPSSSGYSSGSFSFCWAAQLGTWGPSLCWDLILTARTATTDSKLCLQTNWLPAAPGLYHCLTPTCFLWRHNSHSIQLVDSQGYPLISLTGCTSYLHWCIFYLTARPGRRSICYQMIVNTNSNVTVAYCMFGGRPIQQVSSIDLG